MRRRMRNLERQAERDARPSCDEEIERVRRSQGRAGALRAARPGAAADRRASVAVRDPDRERLTCNQTASPSRPRRPSPPRSGSPARAATPQVGPHHLLRRPARAGRRHRRARAAARRTPTPRRSAAGQRGARRAAHRHRRRHGAALASTTCSASCSQQRRRGRARHGRRVRLHRAPAARAGRRPARSTPAPRPSSSPRPSSRCAARTA